jgi:hypothetical protein
MTQPRGLRAIVQAAHAVGDGIVDGLIERDLKIEVAPGDQYIVKARLLTIELVMVTIRQGEAHNLGGFARQRHQGLSRALTCGQRQHRLRQGWEGCGLPMVFALKIQFKGLQLRHHLLAQRHGLKR